MKAIFGVGSVYPLDFIEVCSMRGWNKFRRMIDLTTLFVDSYREIIFILVSLGIFFKFHSLVRSLNLLMPCGSGEECTMSLDEKLPAMEPE